jgi:hypothetical protein
MSKTENKIDFGTGNTISNSPITQGSNRVKNKGESVTKTVDTIASSSKWHKTWWGMLGIAVLASVLASVIAAVINI